MTGRKAHGGKTIYGARVGILLLDRQFPRVPGDIGNALTWPFPVLYKVVRGADHKAVVLDKAKDIIDDFVANYSKYRRAPVSENVSPSHFIVDQLKEFI